jgi:hypothetical protein
VSSSVTDEEGAYRFERLPAGDFYIRASRKSVPAAANQDSGEMPATYFPGTLDPRAAAVISLRAGDIKRAEFALEKARTFSIAGTIKNADESPLGSVRLSVLPQDSTIPVDELLIQGVLVKENFELKGLLPGIYDLSLVSFANTRPGPGPKSAAGGARSVVQIRDESVRDLHLSLESGGEVSGHIKFVGKNTPMPGLRLWLTGRGSLLTDMNQHGGVFESPESFRFSGMAPGVYDVSMMVPESNAYVSDIRAFGRSIVEEGLTVGHARVDSLEVWIDVDGGTVKGSISATKKAPIVVVLASRTSRQRPGDFLRATGIENPSEPFIFSGVPPGLYSLFAFELTSIDEILPIASPDFLPQYRDKSISVNVEKGATVSPPPLILISR